MNIHKTLSFLKAYSDLEFIEEDHTYWLEGKQVQSVSKNLELFHKPFPANAIYGSAKKQGKTVKQLQKEWDKSKDDACAKGSKIHKFAELYNDNCITPTCIEELGVIQFYMNLPEHIIPLVVEIRVYYKNSKGEVKYAGTFDGILYNRLTNKYILYDWKTNKELNKDVGNMLLEPFNDITDTKLHRYYLQLNHYNLALSNHIEIEDMWVIHLKPNIEQYPNLYTLYTVPNLTNKLKEYYEHS